MTEVTYTLDHHAELPHRHQGENLIYPYDDFPTPTIPIDDMPDELKVNGHFFVHVASCPCPRIQREVNRLERKRILAEHEHTFKRCLDCDSYIDLHQIDDWSHRRCNICNITEDD